jgi:DNA invertase Pin-like site-specific DNA recombinase
MNIKSKSLSPKAKAVWDKLNRKTKKAIQSENPFRNDRDSIIRDLAIRGVKYSLLAEITGMSKSAVNRISRQKETILFDKVNGNLKDLIVVFERFSKSVLAILNNISKR